MSSGYLNNVFYYTVVQLYVCMCGLSNVVLVDEKNPLQNCCPCDYHTSMPFIGTVTTPVNVSLFYKHDAYICIIISHHPVSVWQSLVSIWQLLVSIWLLLASIWQLLVSIWQFLISIWQFLVSIWQFLASHMAIFGFHMAIIGFHMAIIGFHIAIIDFQMAISKDGKICTKSHEYINVSLGAHYARDILMISNKFSRKWSFFRPLRHQ